MAYKKQYFKDGEILTAEQLNLMEDGIASLAAIEDVVELPSEDIDERLLYSLLTATLIHNRHYVENSVCYCVDGLPKTGVNATDTSLSVINAYYNTQDGALYGYLDNTLASALGYAAGWYPAAPLFKIAGYDYAGVIEDINEDPNDSVIRVLLDTRIFAYKGKWIELTNSIVEERLPTPNSRGHYAYTVQRKVAEDGSYRDDYELHLISHAINDVYPYQIPLRTNGRIKTKTPVEDLDCTNKKYVDTKVASISVPDLSEYLKKKDAFSGSYNDLTNKPQALNGYDNSKGTIEARLSDVDDKLASADKPFSSDPTFTTITRFPSSGWYYVRVRTYSKTHANVGLIYVDTGATQSTFVFSHGVIKHKYAQDIEIIPNNFDDGIGVNDDSSKWVVEVIKIS